MNIGQYISGAAHIVVLSWIFAGNIFQPQEKPFDVTTVSVVSEQEYIQLTATDQTPDITSQITGLNPDNLSSETLPETESETVDQSPPDQSPRSPDEPQDIEDQLIPPDPLEIPEPDVPLDKVEPELSFESDTPQDLPKSTLENAPLITDRVAPKAVSPQPPDAKIEEDIQKATSSAPEEIDTVKEEVDENTSPEAATTQIITEANKPKPAAPTTSIRPRVRPSLPKPSASDKVDSNSVKPNISQEQAKQNAQASGPPLTSGERENFRLSVQACWVVDTGSPASFVTVTVGLQLDEQGKVVGNSLKLLGSKGGGEGATNTAFQAARRAILRCQKGGYKLPIGKYEQWREIEITFNPEKMRNK